MSVLMVDVKVGESIHFSGDGEVDITLVSKSGQVSRFQINADKSVDVQLPKVRSSTLSIVGEGVKKND